jgi:hypothetical protein
MNKIFFILMGVVWGLVGSFIIISPRFFSSYFKRELDFTEIRWPFGGALIVIGFIFIWSSLIKKAIEAEKKEKDDNKVLMCPKCEKPFYKKDSSSSMCPECRTELEDLSGFYDRHPELKDKKEKSPGCGDGDK